MGLICALFEKRRSSKIARRYTSHFGVWDAFKLKVFYTFYFGIIQ